MTDLAARYGTPREGTTRKRWPFVVLFMVFLTGVIGFWALSQPGAGATIEAQVAGFSVPRAGEVQITARISALPGTPLACAVSATSISDTVVGYRVVELAPSSEAHQRLEVILRTTGEVDGVEVRECWATGEP